ncbi:MAG: hypothetical protein GX815_05170 [Clostridiales bacterium]|nr:hypothetical protein [Clostridiales bacterium]
MQSYKAYFQFKAYYQKTSGEKAHLGDFIELTSNDEIKEKISRISIFPYGINSPIRLTAIQVIALIHQELGYDVVIEPIGESSALFEPMQAKKENPVLIVLRIAFSMLLLFFGSALAIMYFHADVNMTEAHQITYYLISGKKVENPALLSIAYSVGIGAGIAIYFEIFEKLKNKKNPGPLELEMHQAEKELHDYLKDQEGGKGN